MYLTLHSDLTLIVVSYRQAWGGINKVSPESFTLQGAADLLRSVNKLHSRGIFSSSLTKSVFGKDGTTPKSPQCLPRYWKEKKMAQLKLFLFNFSFTDDNMSICQVYPSVVNRMQLVSPGTKMELSKYGCDRTVFIETLFLPELTWLPTFDAFSVL